MAQMLLGKTLALLASVLLFDWAAGQSATIPADQEDACVNVNDNTTITFTCSSPEFFILWRVASRQIRSTEFESVGISVNTTASSGGGYNSTIEFSGEGIAFLESEVGQNVQFRVACLVEKASFDIVEGDSRTFVIYDTPPPPAEDVRVVPTDTALEYNVEWSRPASVLGCVMIVYKVTVINLENEMILRDNIGTTSQQYKYNDTNPDLCQLHEFIVLSDVDGIEGEPASVNVTLPISPNVADISNSLTAQPVLDTGVAIMVSFDPATSCNEADHPIVSYIVTVSQLPQVNRTISHTGSRVALTLTSPDLRDSNYTVVVTACTDILCLPAQPVSVVTSDVQDASIMFLNTTVSLVCVFTGNGTATGCRFTLTLPEEQTETFDLDRPSDGGVVSQMCTTTQNMREAYLSIVVQAVFTDDDDVKTTGEFKFEPFVNETENVADISPCEPPTPEVTVEVVEESTFSPAEIAAIIIAVLVVFSLLLIVLVIIVWWRRQAITTAYKNWVHNMTEDEGIDLMMNNDDTDKPTIKILMKNLTPRPEVSGSKKKSLIREASQQPDHGMAMGTSRVSEDEVALKPRASAEPTFPPTLSGKEPVAAIKMKDSSEPNALQLLLKPAVLAHVVKVWKSKVNRGNEMLLYWKEDEEDVDDDEPYYSDPEDNNPL